MGWDELKLERVGISVYSSPYMHAVILRLTIFKSIIMFYWNSFLFLMVLPLLPDAISKAEPNKVIYFTEVNLNALLF